MVMSKSSDILLSGADQLLGIRWVFVDVTNSAKALARSHLAGSAAGTALAEALTAVAILNSDLEQPEETVSFHMKLDGPIESVLVESAFEGALRGFTGKKILNDFDGNLDCNIADVFGKTGMACIMRSIPGKVISQSTLNLQSTRPADVLTNYYTYSLQRKAIAAIAVVPGEDYIDSARGFFIECMPDGNEGRFNGLVQQISAPEFNDILDAASSAISLCEELGFENIVHDDPRPLFFGCRCSRDRARETLQTVQPDELRTMAKSDKDTDIYCHMCGKCYTFKPEDLINIANGKI